MNSKKTNDSPLSAVLRAETAVAHQLAEQKSSVFDTRFTLNSYVHLLKLLAPYFESYEKAVRSFTHFQIPNVELRLNRSKWLRDDLKNLGDFSNSNRKWDFNLKSEAEVLGMIYVMEGSSLGGCIIAKELEQKLELNKNQLKFYLGYNDDTKALWLELKSFLDSQSLDKDELASCIERANRTFLEVGDILAEPKALDGNRNWPLPPN